MITSIIPADLDAAREEHNRIRPILTRLHAELLKMITKDDAFACAKRLGMLIKQQGKNTIRIGHPLEMAIFSDYQIYMYRPQGMNAVQRLQLRNRYQEGSDERQLLAAMSQARFSVFVIKEIITETGFICIDLYSGNELFIVDPPLARHDSVGLVTGLRIFPLDDCWMYSGVNIALLKTADAGAIKPEGALQSFEEEQELNDSVILKWRQLMIATADGETTA